MSQQPEQNKTAEEIIEEVIAICKAHSDEGCFDHEGARANAIRIVKPWINQQTASLQKQVESLEKENAAANKRIEELFKEKQELERKYNLLRYGSE